MSTPKTGFDTLFIDGFGNYFEAAGFGVWSDEGYEDDDTAIVDSERLPDTPDRAIAISTYGVSDDPSLSNSVLALQVLCRWSGEDPRPARDLAAAVFDLLHAAQHVTLSTGVHIIQCLKNSGPASLGQDSNKRWMNVTNYYTKVSRPSTHRT